MKLHGKTKDLGHKLALQNDNFSIGSSSNNNMQIIIIIMKLNGATGGRLPQQQQQPEKILQHWL